MKQHVTIPIVEITDDEIIPYDPQRTEVMSGHPEGRFFATDDDTVHGVLHFDCQDQVLCYMVFEMDEAGEHQPVLARSHVESAENLVVAMRGIALARQDPEFRHELFGHRRCSVCDGRLGIPNTREAH